jgi:hypothetical protein
MIQTKEKKKIIALAYFFRYGYIASMIMISLLVQIFGFEEFSRVILSVLVLFYGVYMLVGLKFKFIHVYCGMQEAYRLKMNPNRPFEFTKQMSRDLKIIGIFFVIAGVVLLSL